MALRDSTLVLGAVVVVAVAGVTYYVIKLIPTPSQVVGQVGDLVSGAVDTASSLISEAAGGVSDVVDDVADAIGDAGSAVAGAANQAVNQVAGAANQAANQVADAADDIVDAVVDVGSGAVGVLSDLAGAAGSAVSGAGSFIGGLLGVSPPIKDPVYDDPIPDLAEKIKTNPVPTSITTATGAKFAVTKGTPPYITVLGKRVAMMDYSSSYPYMSLCTGQPWGPDVASYAAAKTKYGTTVAAQLFVAPSNPAPGPHGGGGIDWANY